MCIYLSVKWLNLQTVLLLVYQNYVKFVYMILSKTCKIRHYLCHDIRMFIVTYFFCIILAINQLNAKNLVL